MFIIRNSVWAGTLLLGVLAFACKKDQVNIPEGKIEFNIPANFPNPVYRFENNQLSQEGFELGKKLFYDNALSVDKSVSCGSCHQQFAAFANLDHLVSHGVDNCLGARNAPPIFNLAWQKDFMWDGGVHHIELSPLNALTNPCEMGNNLNELVGRLNSTTTYPDLFNKVFGSREINSQRILKALTQFTASMISANSKYDRHIRKEEGGNFTNDEQAGYELFKINCSACHSEPLFTDLSYRSNGLDLNPSDPGRDSITRNPSDRGKFKVPSLRNIELSKPYMHDGRFYTLEEVLAHYTSGVKDHYNLDPLLKTADKPGLSLTQKEQEQIISFLKTLTDHDFINDRRFAEE